VGRAEAAAKADPPSPLNTPPGVTTPGAYFLNAHWRQNLTHVSSRSAGWAAAEDRARRIAGLTGLGVRWARPHGINRTAEIDLSCRPKAGRGCNRVQGAHAIGGIYGNREFWNV
jgi:hypothetical protein